MTYRSRNAKVSCHRSRSRSLSGFELRTDPRGDLIRLRNILSIGALLTACDDPFRTTNAAEDGFSSGAGASGESGESLVASGGTESPRTDAPEATSQGGASGDGTGGGSEISEPDSPDCPTATDLGYRLEFYPETVGEMEEDLHPFFRLVSSSGQAVALSRFKLRYYYSKDVFGDETFECFWVTGNRCADLQISFGDYEPAVTSADRYMEVRLNSPNVFLGLTPVEVRTGFTVEHQPQDQSNDYSFLPGAMEETKPGEFPYQEWTKVTLYLDDQLVWGTEPCTGEDS